MRVFAISDIHVDYEANARWVASLSTSDHRADVLIVAGDLTDTLPLLGWCLSTLATRFSQVLFVPGNHELWTIRDPVKKCSMEKFRDVATVVEQSGASMRTWRAHGLSIVPLFSWYDYSFGEPCEELQSIWMDFRACRWPEGYFAPQVAEYFAGLNHEQALPAGDDVITFSHFLPREDVIPAYMPRMLYPILGSSRLDAQIRRLGSDIHVYGHSHINRKVEIDGISYVNNAFGYPRESGISARQLVCVYES